MIQPARNTPQTLAWEPLDSEHILACPRVAMSAVLHILPEKYVVAGPHMSAPSECCHAVPNIELEAWYSKQVEADKKTPDIYKFYCSVCFRCHVKFCIGGNHPTDSAKIDIRPFWEVR